MPTPVVIMPPINHNDTNIEVQPCIVSPLKYFIKAKNIIKTAIKVIVNPIKVINFNGATEKDVIPSMLKANIFFNGYLDSPASRALRS